LLLDVLKHGYNFIFTVRFLLNSIDFCVLVWLLLGYHFLSAGKLKAT
jgi:hypothetical protein